MPRTDCGKPRRAPEPMGTGPGINVYGWDLLCWALSRSEVQIGKLTEKLSGRDLGRFRPWWVVSGSRKVTFAPGRRTPDSLAGGSEKG